MGFLPVLRRDAFDCWHVSISKYEPTSRFQTGLEYRLEILRPPKQVRPRFHHVKRPKEVPRMLAKWPPRKTKINRQKSSSKKFIKKFVKKFVKKRPRFLHVSLKTSKRDAQDAGKMAS